MPPIRLLMLAGLSMAVGGCSVVSPLPTWELVKATGSMTSLAVARAPSRAVDTVHFGDAPVRRLCIEFNRNVPLPDLVPSLQAELRAQGVASRVYEAGTRSDDCPVWLRYAASVDWGIPPLASEHKPYLSAAAMHLQRVDGALLASSGYTVDAAGFGTSRWATTRTKLAPVVRALITGFE